MSSSHCGSCGAPIIWAKTITGKAMPLDPEPHPTGNMALVDGVAHFVAPDGKDARYRSHFATCPDADKHRRKS